PLDNPVATAADARHVRRAGADGLVVFASPFFMNPEFLRGLAQRSGDPPRELLLGPDVIGDTDLLNGAHRNLIGVVGASYSVPASASPAVRAYVRAHARAFPGARAHEAGDLVVMNYRNAVEATLEALQRAGGNPGPRLSRLRARLAGLRTSLLGAPVRMGADRQAVVSTTLVRVGRATGPAGPALTRVATIPGVDASVGGLVPADYVPTSTGPGECRHAAPPPWAR